ncbi:type 2 isopentenyl-diphosphate Delta-isomerase [Fructilactobacillus cliffordii]|uniref:type 2 isopentenyl-diphosphate Delta-isomerase n=1 Tax=Fructilactobacillus cliffordii TaxID=2940299 RepID=UPI002092E384|nr:type 2 isopentenyl-diphosphate Delta-isomerase [Fructilactobacillus cliffordii]USS86674.1 type 2 isopentenyl-diphosphate Delta-isomerase [Fructilactobacillus cliffordii]
MINRQSHRKDEHVSLAKKFHQPSHAGFADLKFIPNGLPEQAVANIDLKTSLAGHPLSVPFYIEAMTGGSTYTQKLNQQLAQVAKETGLALALGSASVALKDPDSAASFTVARKTNPTGMIMGNVGAGVTPAAAQAVVDLVQADALEVHLNVVQELVMPEGDRDFHWATNLQNIINHVSVPVIVKEVGFGLDQETIRRLHQLGATTVNVGGLGGTNFAQIENFRRKRKEMAYLEDWGLTTVQSLYEAQQVPDVQVVAAGGVTNPLEIAKALALGADAVGIASEILTNLIDNGVADTIQMIQDWIYGLKSIMTALGVRNIAELRTRPVVLSPTLESYLRQRNIHTN